MPKKTNIVDNLFKTPPKEKERKGEIPHFFKTGIPGRYNQADLLFLPKDENGSKYLLVVTDVGTRRLDAEPLKTKNSNEVAQAFGKLYKRKIIPIPEKIRVDAGSEFKGSTLQFLKNKNIIVNIAIVGRHRQMAPVESKNRIIGRELFKKMTAVELLTGKKSNNWVRFLKPLISKMNKQADKIKVTKIKPFGEIKLPQKKKEFLKIGQLVRVQLDNPLGYLDAKRLHGRFRASDIRYAENPRVIMDYLLFPNQPPLYFLNDEKNIKKIDTRVGYTKNQLQIIDENEEYPDRSILTKKQIKEQQKAKEYVVESILDNKIDKKGNMLFKVKWLGFPISQATWETKKNLNNAKDILNDYLQSITE